MYFSCSRVGVVELSGGPAASPSCPWCARSLFSRGLVRLCRVRRLSSSRHSFRSGCNFASVSYFVWPSSILSSFEFEFPCRWAESSTWNLEYEHGCAFLTSKGAWRAASSLLQFSYLPTRLGSLGTRISYAPLARLRFSFESHPWDI